MGLLRLQPVRLATSAVAENQRAASSLGLSPDAIAAANWAIGSALAGMAAILIAPIVGQLSVATMTNLVLAALAAALVAGFRSFPVAFAAGMALGIGQTELGRFVNEPGVAASLPFGVIIAWMIVRGQALPLRDYFAPPGSRQRPDTSGPGGASLVVTALVIVAVPPRWQDAFVTTFAMGLVLLSVVVITGYAGQLSLAVRPRRLRGAHRRPPGRYRRLAVLAGAAGGRGGDDSPRSPVRASRRAARGINLAIVTFGLGMAIELLIFGNGRFTGGYAGP